PGGDGMWGGLESSGTGKWWGGSIVCSRARRPARSATGSISSRLGAASRPTLGRVGMGESITQPAVAIARLARIATGLVVYGAVMPTRKPTRTSPRKPPGLIERLAAGPVISPEGYLFEFRRPGHFPPAP